MYLTNHVIRAYEATKLYRDLKLRGAIMKNKELILLPQEQIYNKVSNTPKTKFTLINVILD